MQPDQIDDTVYTSELSLAKKLRNQGGSVSCRLAFADLKVGSSCYPSGKQDNYRVDSHFANIHSTYSGLLYQHYRSRSSVCS